MASFVLVKVGPGRSIRALWSPHSDSHEEIIRENCIDDAWGPGFLPSVARVEIVPPDNDYSLPLHEWGYSLDQGLVPLWYDEAEGENAARRALVQWAEKKLITETPSRRLLSHGNYIAVGEGLLVRAEAGSTVSAYGNIDVSAYGMSNVVLCGRSHADAIGACLVNAYERATVDVFGGPTVVADQESVVRAHDACTVVAYGRAEVVAGRCTVVHVESTLARIILRDGAVAFAPKGANVEAASGAVVLWN